jgi:hypothetical protein
MLQSVAAMSSNTADVSNTFLEATSHLETIAALSTLSHIQPDVLEHFTRRRDLAHQTLESVLVMNDEGSPTTAVTLAAAASQTHSLVKFHKWMTTKPVSVPFAIKFNLPDLLETLIAAGELSSLNNITKGLFLDSACAAGYVDIVRLLLREINPSYGNDSAACIAIECGHTDVLRLLVADPRVQDTLCTCSYTKFRPAFIHAVNEGHADVVLEVLSLSFVPVESLLSGDGRLSGIIDRFRLSVFQQKKE